MNPPLRVLLSIVVAIFLAGCFQSEVVISVKPDGSGTVTETFLMSKATVEQMKQASEDLGKGSTEAAGDAAKPSDPKAKEAKSEETATPKRFDLLDEKRLKEEASKMGKGVTFVSAKKHSTATGEGYIATYAFTDINQLQINENRSGALPDMFGIATVKAAEPEVITFQFKKGKVAELTIKNPAGRKTEEDKPKGGIKFLDEEAAMPMLQQMFKDMKTTIAVEVAGKVVKTDAEYVAGKRATIMEMDFNKVIANPAKFKELTKANPQTVDEMKAFVKGIDGIKVETKPSVSIQFE